MDMLQGVAAKVEKAVLGLAASAGQQRAVSSDLNQLEASSSSDHGKSQADDLDMLTAGEWPGISPEHVLQTPSQCRTVWRHFVADSELSVQQAMATQQAQRVSHACKSLQDLKMITLSMRIRPYRSSEAFARQVGPERNPLNLCLLNHWLATSALQAAHRFVVSVMTSG